MKSKKILLSIRAFKNLDRFLLIVRKMQNWSFIKNSYCQNNIGLFEPLFQKSGRN